jgi:transcriptional regulator with XRE-family HTH domain
MGLSQLETGQITSPKAYFLMGIAQELGVSMEFLLTGQLMEYDKKLSQQNMEHPSIQHGVKALQELDEKDRQTIISIMSRLRMLKNLEESFPSFGG